MIVLLFGALLVGQVSAGRNPVSWAQARLSVERQPAGDQVSRGLVVVVTPVAEEAQTGEDDADVAGDSGAGTAASGADTSAQVVDASDIVSAAEVSAQSLDAAPEQPADAGAQAAPVANAGAEALQAIATESTAATDAVEAEPASDEPEAPPERKEAAVESEAGDATEVPVVSASSASSAGNSPGLPTSTPTSTNTATPASTSTPSPTATDAATSTPAPTDTATPAPMPTYEIQRGDTLIVIASKHDVRVDDLMRVNNITAADAFSIQPGDSLLIPLEGTVDAASAEPAATREATIASPPTNTPMPTPTTPSLRLDAPILRSPEPGTPVSCASPAALAWLPVPFMRAEDKFVLHLGFVSGIMEDGREVVIWVLDQPFPSSATSWDMDGSLCSLAPQEYSRKWHWYVEVAEDEDGALKPVSPRSQTWDFTWN